MYLNILLTSVSCQSCGNNAEVEINDYKLTRYACYLIAQNGDSRKKLLLLHKLILQFRLENKKLMKKNIVC